jgi:MFS family permease
MSIIIGAIAARFVKNPPAGYTPAIPAKMKQAAAAKARAAVDFTPKEMMKTSRFVLMFIIFLMTASVGLMFIGNMTKIAQTQIGITDSAVLAIIVAFLAITNSGGRVIGGMVSDKIGRTKTLYVVLILQMLNMAAFTFYQSLPALIVGIIGVGFCFGTLLSVFPAMTADLFGLKNFGVNYGIMFMAWGFSGLTAPVIADYFYDLNGNFNTAYIICSVMMAVMVVINFLLQKNVAAHIE